jgi:hypothetical protein
MKPGLIGMVLIALFTNGLCHAQNDTPMEVLVNIANQDERFIPYEIFASDEREANYLNDYLKSYSTLKLNRELLDKIVSEGTEHVAIQLPLPDDGFLELKMINHDIRSDGFAIVDKKTEIEYEVPEAQFYRGIIERGRDSQAGMSFFRDEVYGLFSSLEKGNIILTQDPINPGDGSNYVIYYEKDLLIERSMDCGTDQFDLGKFNAPSASRSNVYSTCEDVEVLIEATRKLYVAKGSVAAVTNYISAFFNNVAIIYRNESIYTSLKRITVNTTEDGYTNLGTSFDKLNRFGEEQKNKYQQYGAELAHLVDVNTPGLGGIAWINALCSNYKYYPPGSSTPEYHYGAYAYSSILEEQSNFPDYSLTVFMFTHEMGHNLGSRHTQWCNWPGGPIDNCVAPEGSCTPGPPPAIDGGTIMSYCHLTGYGINFSNGFGPLPGDVIRTQTASKTCTERYLPSETASATPNKTVIANRECTDEDGWTHYYFDNNTSDELDDLLVLSVRKENENIGNLDDGTLTVKLKTSSNAGVASTHIDNPGYNTSTDWHVMNRWFELVPTNEPQNPVTVRFHYTTRDFMDVMASQPSVESHTDLIFYKVDSPSDPNPDFGHVDVSNEDITFYENASVPSLTTWKYQQNGSNHIAEFKVSSFSGGGGGFTESGQLALPVNLLSYEAEKLPAEVELRWTTSSEVNNDFFTIERSKDGIGFEPIGRVKGSGNTQSTTEYKFIDRASFTGINYYKLRQTDFDGTNEELGIRAVKGDEDRSFKLYPNPSAGGQVFLSYKADFDETITVQISNIAGELVYRSLWDKNSVLDQHMIDVSQFAGGMYLVQIVGNGFSQVQKLIKD